MKTELSTFKTRLGWCAILGQGDLLQAVSFGHRDAESAIGWMADELTADARRSNWNRPLAKRIAAALEGEPDEFRDIEVDLAYLTPFARRVMNLCRKIGWGETTSYGKLAVGAGSPGAARAVGQVMAGNR